VGKGKAQVQVARAPRRNKRGSGKPAGLCATWFNVNRVQSFLHDFYAQQRRIFRLRQAEDAAQAATRVTA
jgi:hypothetical protein